MCLVGLENNFDNMSCYRLTKILLLIILQALAQLHGRELVESAPGSGEKISLYDHAFANICQMINDGCMNVRVSLLTVKLRFF